MKEERVEKFILLKSKYFEPSDISSIREKLLDADDGKWTFISSLQFNNPLVVLFVSILCGSWGVDRFIIGDIGLGIGKLLFHLFFQVWIAIKWGMASWMLNSQHMQQNPFDIFVDVSSTLLIVFLGYAWTMVDWFIIRKASKKKNLQMLYNFLP